MNYIGYFGKLPEKGDFIQHGMDMQEKEFWDGWLQGGIVNARESLAGSWAASYAYRAGWRFLAREGGGQRSGVLLFSHDRVGREFPFIALFGDGMAATRISTLSFADVDASLSFAEHLVRAAYDGLLPAEQLAALLQNLPWRQGMTETLKTLDGSLSSYTSGAPGQSLVLEVVLLQAFIGNDLTREPRSLWWRCAGNGGPERILLNRGPLNSRLFGQLLAATNASALPVSHADVGTQANREPRAADAAQPPSKVTTDPTDDDPVDFNSLLG